uniref:TFIIS N-terminal domain-containing protein n=1 Tax=Triticum urartu TaxID=4572 RepID=A0A8R7QCN1_TRIUA
MDADGRLRRALAAFGGGDVWDLVDAALAAAAPADLRARRDGIVERLYAGARCRNCNAPESPPQPPRQPAEAASPAWQEEGEEEEEEADVDGLGLEEETDEGGGLESKILAIKDFLEDPDQSEEELVSLLQNLADMDITYNALQETDIGRHVNGLRKHPSGDVRQLVKLLVRKWKEIVDGWVRLHNSGGDGGNSILTDGDSPEKTQGKSYQNARVSDFKYTPSPPQRHSGSERPRNNNGFESTLERRRASPAPTYHTKQNNGNNYTTTSSSAPARAMREQKDNHLDEKLDSARKRLQENYQEAQNGINFIDIPTCHRKKKIPTCISPSICHEHSG